MRRLKLVLIVLAVSGVALSCSAWADDNPPGPGVLGWTITPGIGMRLLDIYVTDRQTGARGRITDDGGLSDTIYFSLDIEAPALTFGDFGLTVRAHSGTLKLTHQLFYEGIPEGDDFALRNVNTEVEGKIHYLMPILFYEAEEWGWNTRVGLGYGKWDASLSGDMLLSTDLNDIGSVQAVSINGSVSDRTSWLLFGQARLQHGLIELSVNDIEFSSNDHRFWLSELNIMYGYYFEL
jgi:hypothetical protein